MFESCLRNNKTILRDGFFVIGGILPAQKKAVMTTAFKFLFCLLHITHHFFIIALCAAHFIVDTSLPHTNGTLHIVAGIVIRLDDGEHIK